MSLQVCCKHAELLGDAPKGLSYTGPWEIYNGKWLVPTARVALDGKHVYTSWFDLPSLEDQRAGRVYASFALELEQAGRHTVRIAFDDPTEALAFQVGDRVRVHVVIERRDDVLWLPPAAVREFGGRNFVIVEDARGQSRMDVALGLEGDGRVEIQEGLVEGQTVIGP